MLKKVNKDKPAISEKLDYDTRPMLGPFYPHMFPGRDRSLVQLGQDFILEYKKKESSLRLWKCTTNSSDVPHAPPGYKYGPMIAPIRCFVDKTAKMPQPHKSVCSHLSKSVLCVADPRCGWCESEEKCMEGNLAGPCSANCQKDWRYSQFPISWDQVD